MGVDPRELNVGDTIKYSGDYVGTVINISDSGVQIRWFESYGKPFNHTGRYNFTHSNLWKNADVVDKVDMSVSPVIRKIRRMWDRSNYAKSLTTSAV